MTAESEGWSSSARWRREADTENAYSVSGDRPNTVTRATWSRHTASVRQPLASWVRRPAAYLRRRKHTPTPVVNPTTSFVPCATFSWASTGNPHWVFRSAFIYTHAHDPFTSSGVSTNQTPRGEVGTSDFTPITEFSARYFSVYIALWLISYIIQNALVIFV